MPSTKSSALEILKKEYFLTKMIKFCEVLTQKPLKSLKFSCSHCKIHRVFCGSQFLPLWQYDYTIN